MMKTNVAVALLAVALLVGGQVSAKRVAPVTKDGYDSGYGGYGGDDGYGGYGGEDSSYGGGDESGYGDNYGGGYVGGYGGGGKKKWDDVEMFLKMRELLIESATNAVGFSQLSSLNDFNGEAMYFPYSFSGPVSFYVRDLEKVPPYYKYDYFYKNNGGREEEGKK